MKVVKIVSVLLIHLFILTEYLIADSTTVKVTFISNCGFMITSGDKTVVFDALHTPGYYLSSEEELANHKKLINLEEPFANINLILASHSHPDHFHAGSCAAHLVNNPTGKLIGNDWVIERMQNDTLYIQIQNQLIEVNPNQNEHVRLDFEGITVWAYPIRHFSWYGYYYPHIAYVVNLNGVNIYFGGDNMVEGSEFPFYRIDQKTIHLAFIRFQNLFGSFFESENIDTLNQFISPKVLIPMHFLYGDTAFKYISQVEDSVSKFQNSIPETFIFRNYLESKTFNFFQVSSINSKDEIDLKYRLYQNYPNPFNPNTVISYQLAVNSKVQLTIYDISGKKIKTLVNKRQNAGQQSVTFNATGLASGIYIYKLKAGSFEQNRKMILLR